MNSEICKICGLPKELCVCEDIKKEKTELNIYTEKRKYRKTVTIIEGFNNDIDIDKIAKELKKKLACGGTVKNDHIELQGYHKERVKSILVDMGFKKV